MLVTLWYGTAGWIPVHICRPPANNSTAQSSGATSGGSGTAGLTSAPPTCTGSNVLQYDGTNFQCVAAPVSTATGTACSGAALNAAVTAGEVAGGQYVNSDPNFTDAGDFQRAYPQLYTNGLQHSQVVAVTVQMINGTFSGMFQCLNGTVNTITSSYIQFSCASTGTCWGGTQ